MTDVIVEMKVKCDRTGKVDTLSMTTQEAETFARSREVKQSNASTII